MSEDLLPAEIWGPAIHILLASTSVYSHVLHEELLYVKCIDRFNLLSKCLASMDGDLIRLTIGTQRK